MQTICSILATHLIYKLADCMLSLRRTGFLLTSWLPGGRMTFQPRSQRQSHSVHTIHAWIEYFLFKKHFVSQSPSVTFWSAKSSSSVCSEPEFVLVFLIVAQKQDSKELVHNGTVATLESCFRTVFLTGNYWVFKLVFPLFQQLLLSSIKILPSDGRTCITLIYLPGKTFLS